MSDDKRLGFTNRDLLDRILPLAEKHGLPLEEVADALGMPLAELQALSADAAPEPEPVRYESLIQRVLSEAPFSMRRLAKDSGLSYDTLRSWVTSRRAPRPESLEMVAAYLDRHAKRLQDFAEEIREKLREAER